MHRNPVHQPGCAISLLLRYVDPAQPCFWPANIANASADACLHPSWQLPFALQASFAAIKLHALAKDDLGCCRSIGVLFHRDPGRPKGRYSLELHGAVRLKIDSGFPVVANKSRLSQAPVWPDDSDRE